MTAMAQSNVSKGGLIFSRERVFVETTVTLPIRAAEPKGEEETAKKEEAPTSEKRRYYFDTEIRSEESLKLQWFLSLDNMPSGRATMIVFDDPLERPLPLAKIYKPLDVLVLGDDGAILAILPEIVLATQTKLISVDMPVKAFMFIRSGEAALLHIKPKDMVQHALFTLNPTVLQ
jgi:hypothetical protein